MNRSSAVILAPALLLSILAAAPAAHAQSAAWEKTYDLNGQPSLSLDASDSNVAVTSCGDCRKVHIRIEMKNASLSDYNLEESQTGNSVRFALKPKSHVGFHINWKSSSSVNVLVETPAALTLDARTSDGSLSATGLTGTLAFTSSDGSQILDGLSGSVKVKTSDGSLTLRNGRGTLEARSSDGSQVISGTFDSLQLASSDGSLSVDLLKGSKLLAPSSVESHDGSVTVHLPRELAAELDIESHDGSIKSDLPLTLNGFNSRDDSGRSIHGTLNGGGPLLRIRSSDGSVKLAAS